MIIEEVAVKTHLIITDITQEYHVNWCGKILDTHPQLKDGKPVFIIVGSQGRMELNTIDIHQLEESAKHLTYPRGRGAVTSDASRIYIKEANGSEKLMAIVTHKQIKTYSAMFDKVGYI